MTLPGLPSPWVILAAVVGGVALGLGGYFYGDHVGSVTTASEYRQRDLETAATAAATIAKAQAIVNKAHDDAAAAVDGIAAGYEKQLKDKDDEKIRAVAAARTSGLYVHTIPEGCGNPVPSTGPSARVGDGGAKARLSNDDAEFFIGLATRADKVVGQLTACQKILVEDRAQVNGK